jgi:hypothetical protein
MLLRLMIEDLHELAVDSGLVGGEQPVGEMLEARG